jgi:acyl carrier protein
MAIPPGFEQIVRRQSRSMTDDSLLDPQMSFESLGVDSLGLINIVAALEEKFALSVPDDLMTAGVLYSPDTLWAAVAPYVPNHLPG